MEIKLISMLVIDKRYLGPGIILVCIIVSVFVILCPGLSSPLYVDDFGNLNDLTEISTRGYAYYVFNGFASTLGRPLSLLTFALQHSDWPHNPFSFKLVNLFIHSLNGFLLYFISRFFL